MNALLKHLGRISLAFSTLVGPAFAADAAGWPPPGQYFIDADTVTTIAVGGVQRITHTEGTTGKMTTTLKAPGVPPQTSVFNTGKPNTWCVHQNGAPPVNMPGRCQTTAAQVDTAGSSFSASCQGMAMDSTFRKVDARTWEHAFTVQVANNPPPSAASRESMIRNMPGLTAAQRQEALAAMPAMADAVAQRDAAMARARAELAQEIATGTPEEAADARQSLAAMAQAGFGGAGRPAGVRETTQVKERWTLTGRACDAGQ